MYPILSTLLEGCQRPRHCSRLTVESDRSARAYRGIEGGRVKTRITVREPYAVKVARTVLRGGKTERSYLSQFALTEAMALFVLMMAFLILFTFL